MKLKVIRFKRLIDIFTCVILILCMLTLPTFIIINHRMNTRITEQVSGINILFDKLEGSHNLNAKLIFDTLEFRRAEYRCYLTKEDPKFINILEELLSLHTKYLSNDNTLSAEAKQKYMYNIRYY